RPDRVSGRAEVSGRPHAPAKKPANYRARIQGGWRSHRNDWGGNLQVRSATRQSGGCRYQGCRTRAEARCRDRRSHDAAGWPVPDGDRRRRAGAGVPAPGQTIRKSGSPATALGQGQWGMNYRHAYHAGNFADVVKHVVLARIVEYLKRKEKPFRVIDTHAGIGLYDLAAEEAGKTGEWLGGIGRVMQAKMSAEAEALLEPYLDAVRAVNETQELAHYPGS